MVYHTDPNIGKNHKLLDLFDIIALLTRDIVDIPHQVDAIGGDTKRGITTPEQHTCINSEFPGVFFLLEPQTTEGELIAHPQIGLNAVGLHVDAELTIVVRHHQIGIAGLMKNRAIGIHHIMSIGPP